MTLWQARFKTKPASELKALSSSIEFDRRLAFDDLAGSSAHVRGLQRGGVLSSSEAAALLAALAEVRGELADGSFAIRPADEDIHTAVERRVTEIAGSVGGKLHTGRSRNDQVTTDLRLFARRELEAIARQVLDLQGVLATKAEQAGDAYLPGYTHMQRAQPVLLSHHLLAHGWALTRDVDRLIECTARMNVSPLGAGALAGSSLPLDPDGVAAELGFARRFENSIDSVSDRDYVAEALFDLALLGIHLSRLGEEIVLWATEEFGFVTLDDAYSTGSSMLPQKKNPDIAELVRGKSGRLIGHVAAVLAMLKGLPLSYNRDLQEDKEPLFDAIDQLRWALSAFTGLIRTAAFDRGRMARVADHAEMHAVDLAEWLVEKGMPFRRAHETVASIVRESSQGGGALSDLVAGHPDLGPEAVRLLEPEVSMARRGTPGGTGTRQVADQLERFSMRLIADGKRVGSG